MVKACERTKNMELVDVTVYYLEMLAPSQRDVPAPRDGLTVLNARTPTVPYYRFLYNAVGQDYHRRQHSHTSAGSYWAQRGPDVIGQVRYRPG